MQKHHFTVQLADFSREGAWLPFHCVFTSEMLERRRNNLSIHVLSLRVVSKYYYADFRRFPPKLSSVCDFNNESRLI